LTDFVIRVVASITGEKIGTGASFVKRLAAFQGRWPSRLWSPKSRSRPYFPPRYHVNMHMRHGLAGGGPGVEADVVAIGLRLEPRVEQAFHLAHELHHRRLFRGRAVKVGGHHPPRDHQRMPGRHRKRIEARKGEDVCAQPLRLGDGRER
jgi:hypothetical protein